MLFGWPEDQINARGAVLPADQATQQQHRLMGDRIQQILAAKKRLEWTDQLTKQVTELRAQMIN